MKTVGHSQPAVNGSGLTRGRGQPSKQTPGHVRAINRALVQAALKDQPLPADSDLAHEEGISARTVRTIRLSILGLDRREVKDWQAQARSARATTQSVTRELICATPFAGLWLLVPQLIDRGLAPAAERLRTAWSQHTRVRPVEIVLTLVAWAALGFRRLMHVDDFRHSADLGLALFTGHWHLWSDTTLWRWVHGVTQKSATAFYQATAALTAAQSDGPGRFSLDEHVVPVFTTLKPRRLGKTRVPSRGRAYPAFRLYLPFDLDLGRFVGLLVRKARESLSQTALALIVELRRLRRLAGVPNPDQLRLILDRGGYKGSLFATLLADPGISFIAMARATAVNVRQWAALPERCFRPYHPAGEDNLQLKIARTTTTIHGCPVPVPSIVIRDDTPETKQRWRVLFYKDAPGQHPHAKTLDAEYRQRQDHEQGFAQYVHALAGHCLPKAYAMTREPNADGQRRTTVSTAETPFSQQAVHLVAWVKALTFNLIRDFGAALGAEQAHWQVGTLARRYLVRPGRLYLQARALVVQLDPFRGAEALEPFIQQLNARRLAIPWLFGLILHVEIAPEPVGLAATPHRLGRKILAYAGVASLP
jgi:hypothetical protein